VTVDARFAAFDSFDIFGADFAADPYPILRGLRESGAWRDPRTGLWLIGRYQDVRRVLLDPETFPPDNALAQLVRFGFPALRILAAARFELPPTLANNGGPSHQGLRALVGRFLSAAAVKAAIPVIERIVDAHIARVATQLADTGRCDLARGLARDVPFEVMFEMLDLTRLIDVGVDTLAGWTGASLDLFWGFPAAERQEDLARRAAGFHRWLTGLVQRADRDESAFLRAIDGHRLPDGAPLGTADRVALCYFMIIAGQVTTGQMLSTMFHRALGAPEVWKRFGADPGVIEPWAEEVLRRDPPITTWRRVCATRVRFGDVEVPAGSGLLLMLAGSGSDPRVFAGPEEIRPSRANTRQHLSFGLGRHRCPGAELARVEAKIMLERTARRLPGLRLAAGERPETLTGLLSFRAPTRVVVTTG
jgi:cytochrome P450